MVTRVWPCVVVNLGIYIYAMVITVVRQSLDCIRMVRLNYYCLKILYMVDDHQNE